MFKTDTLGMVFILHYYITLHTLTRKLFYKKKGSSSKNFKRKFPKDKPRQDAYG